MSFVRLHFAAATVVLTRSLLRTYSLMSILLSRFLLNLRRAGEGTTTSTRSSSRGNYPWEMSSLAGSVLFAMTDLVNGNVGDDGKVDDIDAITEVDVFELFESSMDAQTELQGVVDHPTVPDSEIV